jgi:hypothetical protein
MDIDILTPEFISLGEKAKAIYERKQAKSAEFKKLWESHKQELAQLEAEAEKIKSEYEAASKRFLAQKQKED